MRRRLLCTDLDRTLIPNGTASESPRARELFERIAKRPEVTLVYVTGRHRALVEQAIADYSLPTPAYAITDVGTNIYEVSCDGWHLLTDWQAQLQNCWAESQVEKLICRLEEIPSLTLQEHDKQGRFKVSYYAKVEQHFELLRADVARIVGQPELSVNLIWSHDQQTGNGLLDILPMHADKLTAIRHVMSRLGFNVEDTLFSGDSGNDMRVFCSEIPSVIVANADDEIKQCALHAETSPIYVAKGSFAGLNGNYRAGIIEGACHFWPETRQWILDN